MGSHPWVLRQLESAGGIGGWYSFSEVSAGCPTLGAQASHGSLGFVGFPSELFQLFGPLFR